MNSAEAREYVRLATTETKGRTKIACDLLINESVKLEKIKQMLVYNDHISRSRPYHVLEMVKEVLENE